MAYLMSGSLAKLPVSAVQDRVFQPGSLLFIQRLKNARSELALKKNGRWHHQIEPGAAAINLLQHFVRVKDIIDNVNRSLFKVRHRVGTI